MGMALGTGKSYSLKILIGAQKYRRIKTDAPSNLSISLETRVSGLTGGTGLL